MVTGIILAIAASAQAVAQPATLTCTFLEVSESGDQAVGSAPRELTFFMPRGVEDPDLNDVEIFDDTNILEGRRPAFSEMSTSASGRPHLMIVTGETGQRMIISMTRRADSAFEYDVLIGRVAVERVRHPEYGGRCFYYSGPDARELLQMVRNRTAAGGSNQ